MISNNAADHAVSAKGGASGVSAAPSALKKPSPVSAAVIGFEERGRSRKLAIRLHWGLLFAVGASLVLWLLIWACLRLFF